MGQVRVLLFLIIINIFPYNNVSALTVEGDISEELIPLVENYYSNFTEEKLYELLDSLNISTYSLQNNKLIIYSNPVLEKIIITGNIVYLDSTLKSVLGLNEGTLYLLEEFLQASKKLREFYISNGYPDVKLDYTLQNNILHFDITEGKLYVVDDIEIINMDFNLKNAKLQELSDIPGIIIPLFTDIRIIPMILNNETKHFYKNQIETALRSRGYYNFEIKETFRNSKMRHPFINIDRPFSSILSVFPAFHRNIVLQYEVSYGPIYQLNVDVSIEKKSMQNIKKHIWENLKKINTYYIRLTEKSIESFLINEHFVDPAVNISIKNNNIEVDVEYKVKYSDINLNIKYKNLSKNHYLQDSLEKYVLSVTDPDFYKTVKSYIFKKLKEDGYITPEVKKYELVENDVILNVNMEIKEGRKFKINNVYINNELYLSDVKLPADSVNIKSTKDILDDKIKRDFFYNFIQLSDIKIVSKNKVDVYFKSDIHNYKLNNIIIHEPLITKKTVMRYFKNDNKLSREKVKQVSLLLDKQPHISYHKITPIVVDKEKTDLILQTNESKKNQLFGNISYDSIDNIRFLLGYRRKNFLNSNHMLELHSGLSFKEEWAQASMMGFDILGKQLSDRIMAKYRDRDEDDYKYTHKETSFSLNWNRKRYDVGISLFLEDILIYENDYDDKVKNLFLNKHTNYGLRLSYKYYMVDSKLSPNNGFIFSINFTPSNIFNDNDFYKTELKLSLFKTFLKRFLFYTSGETGVISGDNSSIPLIYRYTMGGPYKMRAYNHREIGLEDSNGNTYGGKYYYYGITNISYRLVNNLYLGPFFELGSVHNSSSSAKTYKDIGLMFNYKTNVGSFVVSYAYNPDKNHKSRQALYISFATSF